MTESSREAQVLAHLESRPFKKGIARLFRRVGLPESEDGCMPWLGSLDGGGYGKLSVWIPGDGSAARTYFTVRAHRLMYFYAYRRLDPQLQLDHLCRTRICVRPTHLEEVTNYENQRRSPLSNMNKTHCRRGHVYSSTNTYLYPLGDRRECRTCRAEHVRAHRKRKSQLAEFDQAYAESKHLLKGLVEGYAEQRRENDAAGLPERMAIMMLATALTEEWGSTELVYALTAAVVQVEAS